MNEKLLQEYEQSLRFRGLTPKSVKAYLTYIRYYLVFMAEILLKPIEESDWNDKRHFIEWIQEERNLSDRTVNHIISELKSFTIYQEHKPWDDSQLPRRKFDTYIPYVPSLEDTLYFIDTIPDTRDKAMLSLLYSAGLRIGELCHLKYGDILGRKKLIHITEAKNRHDRYALLSDRALEILIRYWYEYGKPMDWLFPGLRDKTKPIGTSYLRNRIHEHEDRLGWERKLSCHSFRHALGTHLYEAGNDLFSIQKVLGHRSLRSTLIYITLSNKVLSEIKNPFDSLSGDK